MKDIKLNKAIRLSGVLFLFFMNVSIISQNKEIDFNNLDNLEQEEWEALRDYLAVEVIKLMAKLDTLNSEIDSLRELSSGIDNLDCNFEIRKLVGNYSDEELEDFRKKFKITEEKVLSRTGVPEEAWKRYFSEISISRMKCLPEFSERLNSITLALDEWMESEKLISTKSYTVKKGDSLRRIAQEKLGDHNLWYEIWQLNKIIIVNPNLIFPGQVLILPDYSK